MLKLCLFFKQFSMVKGWGREPDPKRSKKYNFFSERQGSPNYINNYIYIYILYIY